MKKFLVILILAALGYYMYDALYGIGIGIPRFTDGVKDFYLDKTVSSCMLPTPLPALWSTSGDLIPWER
jgi:hypothetical protein